MTIMELLVLLKKRIPLEFACDWDNVGLLIGDGKAEINKVLLTLDVTENALNKAIQNDCNIIISHHPVIFGSIKKINKPLYLNLIRNNIDVISMHTNFDSTTDGLNLLLAHKLGLSNVTLLENLGDEYTPYGIGMVGELEEEMELNEFASFVKKQLDCPFVNVWQSNTDSKVKHVAVCGGSGGSLLSKASSQADVMVTGDITYHTMLDSPISLVDAGHFYTEIIGMEYFEKFLNDINIEWLKLETKEHEINKLRRI